MFHERLKEARLKNKYSQEEIAEKLNIARSNISKYENGNLEPNLTLLRDFCKIYKVSADYLLEIEGNSNE